MTTDEFDFYDKTSLKSYNLTSSMRYQLSMLDKLDVFTRKHCENVASIVCRLCEHLHLNKDFTCYCTICAYLHDLGKIFIPPEILQKPAKLTDEEYAVMKSHTLIGYKMCMEDLQLRPYALGAKYHHESLDGSGYPEKLQGNQIPLEAQIIKVADEYDAIVSKRQYKSHISISDTLKILIDETKPSTKDGVKPTKVGKLNKKVVKCLFKVVIEDIEYEISCLIGYLDFLQDQVKRLNAILDYEIKMNNTSNEKKKNYFKEGMQLLFSKGENYDNYQTVLDEYNVALKQRQKIIDDLYEEIKIIKKLKV